ncbi:MAG: helix-hairpin-helix domain-containing protein, partial [Candidatus Paceibacterota bacterium]
GYKQLSDYKKDDYKSKSFVKELQDINTCDSIDLIKVFGIGPTLSSRILKYRNRLGGFYDFEQLSEVYNIKPEIIEEIRTKFVLKVENIKTIKINSANFSDLIKHPYLNKNEVNILLNYRKQHGNYNTMDDLLKTLVLDEEKINKLKNYIEF